MVIVSEYWNGASTIGKVSVVVNTIQYFPFITWESELKLQARISFIICYDFLPCFDNKEIIN